MSSSGLVAKKIALFEIRPPGSENQCRLKRKHAIRRKRYVRERRSIIVNNNSSSALSIYKSATTSQENLGEVNDKKCTTEITKAKTTVLSSPSFSLSDSSSGFYTSCSALEILSSPDSLADYNLNSSSNYNNNSSSRSPPPYSKSHSHSLPLSVLTRSTSLGDFESQFKRINLVDIDIDNDTQSVVDYGEISHLYESSEFISISDHVRINNNKNSKSDYFYDLGSSSNNNNSTSNNNKCTTENYYENIFVPGFVERAATATAAEAKAKAQAELLLSSSSRAQRAHNIAFSTGVVENSSGSCNNSNSNKILNANINSGHVTILSKDKAQNKNQNQSQSQNQEKIDPEDNEVEEGEEEPFYEELYDYCLSTNTSCTEGDCESANNKNNLCSTASGQTAGGYRSSGSYSSNSGGGGSGQNNKNKTELRTSLEASSSSPSTTTPTLAQLKQSTTLLQAHEVDVAAALGVNVPYKKDAESSSPPTSRAPTPPPYESLYSEPIYGTTSPSNFVNSSPQNSTPPSIYNNHTTSSSNNNSSNSAASVIYGPGTIGSGGSTCLYNDSMASFDPGSSIIYGLSEKLPPPPPNKFSSIAKSAGRRIAKKFLQIRRLSRTSLDNFDTPSLSSSSTTSGSVSKENGRESREPIRRAISRPSIPPPEPPKSDYGGSSTYNVYTGNTHSNDEFDDSDFYDSDSELIRNFVSQVQPIYSMEEEPLYQYYTYGITLKPEDDYQPVIPKNLGLTLDMLVPRVGQRTLWCELPEVMSSGILGILSDKQKQLQEAIFEILTSEVSYLKSLDVLISLFYKNEELIGVLTEEERGFLFGNIVEVKDCAQAFLAELLAKWEESWYIQEIGEIIIRNTNTRFSVYTDYCRNKPCQDKALQRLKHSRDEFVNVIKTIEENPKCQMLRMDSFLMLPMQRITRLPLLVNAVIQRTQSLKEKSHCEEALKNLTNLVLACNDAARESQDAEETAAIIEKIEFPRGMRSQNLGQFVMKGDFMKNPFDQGRGNQINWTFRKSKRTFYWLLLFTNHLLITKKKTNGKFEVLDLVVPVDSFIKPLPNLEGVSKDFQHFFMLHFNRKETVYFLAARTQSEVERWKQKLETLKTQKDLRVEAIFPYEARRDDELSFTVGDFIQVSQMQPDGWYFGKKLDTGNAGWFPGNYCCEA